jgi:hypothetical protein
MRTVVPVDSASVCLLYRQGRSIHEISRRLSLSPSKVRRTLLRSGEKLRDISSGIATSGLFKAAVTRSIGRKHPPRSLETRQRISAMAKLRPCRGTRTSSSGYIEFTTGPNKGRSVHVLAMENLLGRRLRPNEIVHHKDENRTNNDLSNLELLSRGEHSRLHRLLEISRGKRLELHFVGKGLCA